MNSRIHLYVSHIRAHILANPIQILTSFNDDDVVRGLDDTITDMQTKIPVSISHSAWKCPICLGLPRIPTTLRTCGHVACKECILNYLDTGTACVRYPAFMLKPCPMCRTTYTRLDVLTYDEWPILAKQIWTHMRVQCQYCKMCDNPPMVVDHEMHKCEMRHCLCPGCGFTANIEDTMSHALQCERVMVNCLQCGYPAQLIGLQQHDCAAILLRIQEHQELHIVNGPRGAVSRMVIDDAEWIALYGSPPAMQLLPVVVDAPTLTIAAERRRRRDAANDATEPHSFIAERRRQRDAEDEFVRAMSSDEDM